MHFRRMLRPTPPSDPDLRPGLLSVACLFFILLPCLLFTTSMYRLTSLPFHLPGAGAAVPMPEAPSPIEGVEVMLSNNEIRVRTALRTTDVTAKAGDAVWSEAVLPARDGHPNFNELRARLSTIHSLDPAWKKVTLIPGDEVSTDDVVALMDAVREGGSLTEITLGTSDPKPPGSSVPDLPPADGGAP